MHLLNIILQLYVLIYQCTYTYINNISTKPNIIYIKILYIIIILMKKPSFVAMRKKMGLFASFKIIFLTRRHWDARMHVRSTLCFASRFISFQLDPRRSLWIEGRFRGITMNTLPNHGAYVCTGRRFLDNPPTRDRIRTCIYICI